MWKQKSRLREFSDLLELGVLQHQVLKIISLGYEFGHQFILVFVFAIATLRANEKKKEQIIETNYVAETENHGLTREERRIERFLYEIPKVAQTNSRLMHHIDNLLFLLFELFDLLLVLFQLDSGCFQIVIQANLILRVIVV